MTLSELANKEAAIYKIVIALEGSIDNKLEQLEAKDIFSEYATIHQNYSQLSKDSIEAIKRGLFLIWYNVSEPPFLTGISQLDNAASEDIIRALNDLLSKSLSDNELEWMISYYGNWDFIFDRFQEYESFQMKLKTSVDRPKQINKALMENRGQMGIYFSSLSDCE